MKDEIISRLNEELVKRETQLKFDVERMRKKFEDDLYDMRTELENINSDLQEKLVKAEKDLSAVEYYMREKEKIDEECDKYKQEIENQKIILYDALEDQERKFLEEKSQIYKDLDAQKAAFREIALKDARKAMSTEAKKMLLENNRIHEELKFHHSMSTELQAEKQQLQTLLSTSKRDASILADQELGYANQAYFKTKEIKSLRERVDFLEKQAVENSEKFKLKTKELQSATSKDLEEASLDAAGLRRLIKIKNSELRQMKSLAATILSQRTETEQFFLEALQEVKDVVKKERRRAPEDTKIAINKLKATGGSTIPNAIPRGRDGDKSKKFPPLNIHGKNLHYLEQPAQSNLPQGAVENVVIKDLTWEDKELVLRVLFAKMNGKQSNAQKTVKNKTKKMPPATFISEGALAPEETDAAMYQTIFEDTQYHDGEEEILTESGILGIQNSIDKFNDET